MNDSANMPNGMHYEVFPLFWRCVNDLKPPPLPIVITKPDVPPEIDAVIRDLVIMKIYAARLMAQANSIWDAANKAGRLIDSVNAFYDLPSAAPAGKDGRDASEK